MRLRLSRQTTVLPEVRLRVYSTTRYLNVDGSEVWLCRLIGGT